MASSTDSGPCGPKRSSGRSVGHFIIDKEIGKGSFAQVYMGYHKETKAAVAIKSVELERLNKKLKENLYSEIQILKTLRHPHIVALHDCFESSTHINLIMEYCELGDLSLFIKKREKLMTHPATHDLARKYPCAPNSGLHEVVIRHFLKQLSSALEFLRRKNYVHRDVKPQNLLLLSTEVLRAESKLTIMEASQDSLIPVSGLATLPMLKLADFGFARVLPSTSLAETLCGSPLYMAPEILRYERYDAKADLWSVGTVLYEMITGRPPFRARNHVELLRKIEAAEDVIKFPREVIISAELKALVRSLLKRSPVERLSFENFFGHPAITGDIPGLVEDDITELRNPTSSDNAKLDAPRMQVSVTSALNHGRQLPQAQPGISRDVQTHRQTPENTQQGGAVVDAGDDHGIRRPKRQNAVSLPTGIRTMSSVTSGSNASADQISRQRRDDQRGVMPQEHDPAHDVMFERDYVLVERRHVEVNALADELAANEKFQAPTSSNSGHINRRQTRVAPNAVPISVPLSAPSRTALVAPGRGSHDRRASYEKALSASPGSASAISKAIQDASLRLFGFKVPPIRNSKGQSPPTYQPFPVYPIPSPNAGLLTPKRRSRAEDDDARAAQTIEDYATRSDCVYGFAEVKYKQLVPLAPSADQGIGGYDVEQLAAEGDGLTVEATMALSEEALVLYVKSLTLLARAMDIASLWWGKRSRVEVSAGVGAAVSPLITQRINAVVQWVRQRFNEVLEKSEIVRLKLQEAQRLLPDDHPSHPSNHTAAPTASPTGSANARVFISIGTSAEKLMYDRALEMSRAAAIDEAANGNLPACELSYITAIRMLEAVLDIEDERQIQSLGKGKGLIKDDPDGDGGLEGDEAQYVRSIIQMITQRLASVRRKQQMIVDAQGTAQPLHAMARQRSGEATPHSVRSQASS